MLLTKLIGDSFTSVFGASRHVGLGHHFRSGARFPVHVSGGSNPSYPLSGLMARYLGNESPDRQSFAFLVPNLEMNLCRFSELDHD